MLEKSYKALKLKQKASQGYSANNLEPKDVYDKSDTTSKSNEIRYDLIASIKKKIKLGYYNSQAVLEDLSDSFAKAMNNLE